MRGGKRTSVEQPVEAARASRETSRAARNSPDASLAILLADLEGLDVEALRRQWRNRLGGQAPAHLPRWLLLRVFGHRLQVAAHGDLDKAVRRVVRAQGPGDGPGRTAPFERRDPQTREGIGLKPGALLVREWRGKLERVIALEEGFAWNGATYRSLSQIAKAMTGTSWNGHRFFGLRPNKEAALADRKPGLPRNSNAEPAAGSGKRHPKRQPSSAGQRSEALS
jgi:Protein of unknown function (DUF2924)